MISVLSTLFAVVAGCLAGYSLVGAWDEFSKAFVTDLDPMLAALSMDPEKYRTVLRWSGIICVAVLLLMGFALNMFPVAIVVMLFVFFAPRWILKAVLARRKALLRDQMVSAAIALANASRAGLSLPLVQLSQFSLRYLYAGRHHGLEAMQFFILQRNYRILRIAVIRQQPLWLKFFAA